MGQNPCKVMIPPPQRATMSHSPAPKQEIDTVSNQTAPPNDPNESNVSECLRGGWGHMFLSRSFKLTESATPNQS